jgi:type II secretory pathway pseudopilin PulG
MIHRRARDLENGDTIVEVLISMTILALVLAATFVSTSHSLQTGTDSTDRQQALTYAQQQVETIKDGINSGAYNQYFGLSSQTPGQELTPTQAFCIPTSGESAGQPRVINSPGDVTICSSGQYQLNDSFSSSTGLITINVTWSGSTSSGSTSNKLTVYYNIPDPGAY